jgi:hypothetical protein
MVFRTLIIALLMVASQGLWQPPQPSVAAEQCATANTAWIVAQGFGANCMDESGWHVFEANSGAFPVAIADMTACSDGKLWAAHSAGLSVNDGSGWTLIRAAGVIGIKSMVCSAANDIWVGHLNGVARYSGDQWTMFDRNTVAPGMTFAQVQDIAMTATGTLWVSMTDGVSAYDGSTWTAYKKDETFKKSGSFSSLAVASDGTVWAAQTLTLWRFDGSAWSPVENTDLAGVTALVFDGAGKLWVGTSGKGLWSYADGAWTSYTRANSDITGDALRTIAVDGRGRVWVGTDWGMNIFDGTTWQAYHMHTSPLLDNATGFIYVTGDGPPLPTLEEKPTGALTGIIEMGKAPVSGAKVELCTLFVGILFDGATPCDGHPLSQIATTDENGVFRFDSLAPGRYSFVVQRPDGQWVSFIGIDSRVEVKPGETTDIEDIDVSG